MRQDHVAQATVRILRKGDETGRPETLRAQFPDRGPVEQVAGLDTASRIVGRKRARPGDGGAVRRYAGRVAAKLGR